MFVAINNITCKPEYTSQFEQLFGTRAKAIDEMPGFIRMHVLRPKEEGEDYLIMSFWEDESFFKAWTKSNAFIEGHRRGFEDIKKARQEGQEPPMKSTFKTYEVFAN